MAGYTGHSRYRRARKRVLERDGYLCQVRGPHCKVEAHQADHIIPVEDGGAIYDEENMRASCGPCNIWRAQAQKAKEGWKRARARIVLVVGPPGAGKSTYVSERATADDLVIDYDHIAEALGPLESRTVKGGRHDATMAARNAILTKMRRGELDARVIWLISANPEAERMFPHHEVVVIDPGRDRVQAQAATTRPLSYAAVIDSWYARRAPEIAPREW